MDYKNAGVDIEAGYKSVELMKEHVKKTMRPEVLGGLGGFSGAFSLAKIKEMEEPVLLSGTDGCGTKVKLAMILDKHDTIGIDAVAMCVNDIACAGGEPLLYGDQVVSAMARARELGFDVSLISNGSRLTADLAARIAPHLTILGISIDATTSATNERIGRLDGRGIQLDLAGMIDHIAFMRSLNPAMTLKVNTVVNEVNWQEDLTSLISDLEPTRWKVLRMLPVVTKELALNDDQFQAFVDRHHILDSIMCVEGNDDMVQSYIMVDPHGRFFQNRSVGAGYDYSPLIIDMGALEAFDCMTWSAEKFVARYPRISK